MIPIKSDPENFQHTNGENDREPILGTILSRCPRTKILCGNSNAKLMSQHPVKYIENIVNNLFIPLCFE